jgi:hypothetical protein
MSPLPFTPPPGGALSGGMVMPKNYMVEAIIVTILSFFCCGSLPSLILGVIAIVKANNVQSSFNSGRYEEAINNANTAKKLCIWAVVIDIVCVVLLAVFYLVIGFTALFPFLGAMS